MAWCSLQSIQKPHTRKCGMCCHTNLCCMRGAWAMSGLASKPLLHEGSVSYAWAGIVLLKNACTCTSLPDMRSTSQCLATVIRNTFCANLPCLKSIRSCTGLLGVCRFTTAENLGHQISITVSCNGQYMTPTALSVEYMHMYRLAGGPLLHKCWEHGDIRSTSQSNVHCDLYWLIKFCAHVQARWGSAASQLLRTWRRQISITVQWKPLFDFLYTSVRSITDAYEGMSNQSKSSGTQVDSAHDVMIANHDDDSAKSLEMTTTFSSTTFKIHRQASLLRCCAFTVLAISHTQKACEYALMSAQVVCGRCKFLGESKLWFKLDACLQTSLQSTILHVAAALWPCCIGFFSWLQVLWSWRPSKAPCLRWCDDAAASFLLVSV